MAASERDAGALPRDYPPAEHVLRDLRLWADPGAEPPCAGLPVVAEVRGAALLRADGDALLLRVEARDAGAEDRLCALAAATVGSW